MVSTNMVILLGNAGADPEIRELQNGNALSTFSIATNRKVGEEQYTDWHNIVTFGKLAKIVADKLYKGDVVEVIGRMQYRKWEGDDGKTRVYPEVVANSVSIIPRGGE